MLITLCLLKALVLRPGPRFSSVLSGALKLPVWWSACQFYACAGWAASQRTLVAGNAGAEFPTMRADDGCFKNQMIMGPLASGRDSALDFIFETDEEENL